MNTELIKELRAKTHLGMMECADALKNCSNDVDKAVDFLMSKGSLKKVEGILTANEGKILAGVVGSEGRILEVNCQTDFAAKGELFQNFVTDLLQDKFDQLSMDRTENDKMEVFQHISRQTKEQISIKRMDRIAFSESEAVEAYNHHNGKISVLVVVRGGDATQTSQAAKDVAVQVAATKPQVVDRSKLPQETIDRQRQVYLDQMKMDPRPKPPQVQEKIVDGKMNKWFSEVCLVDQESVLAPGKTINELLPTGAEIVSFIRYELGE